MTITLVSVGIGSGLSPCGGAQPKNAAGLFDPELAVLDDSLQRFPNSRIGENIAIVEHQIAAVGLADGAGLDQCKIGNVAADDRFFFNDAEEIVISRIGFNDDRRPLRFTVIDEHIDSVG